MGMTDEQRERILCYVIRHMSVEVAEVAGRAATDLAENTPEVVKEVLRPIFEWTDDWPFQVAATALGFDPERPYEA